MLYLISLLPLVIYLFVIKAMDGFSLVRWIDLIIYIMWGSFACGAVFFLAKSISWEQPWIAPLLEEALKFIFVFVFIVRKKLAFFAETIIHGCSIGAGFALLENILYVALSPDLMMGNAIIRGFGTALIHMGCTAFCACLALLLVRMVEYRKFRDAGFALSFFLPLIPSVAVHYLWNLFLLPEFLQMVAMVFVFFGCFIGIYHIDNKQIHQWLDVCISNDIELLSAIEQGQLSNTNAGQYLMMMKDRFHQETFFDIIVYLGLYLKLTIEAKSRMMLQEAQLDMPLTAEEIAVNRERLTELHTLEKNIGATGRNVLRPIVFQNDTDRWALENMLTN